MKKTHWQSHITYKFLVSHQQQFWENLFYTLLYTHNFFHGNIKQNSLQLKLDHLIFHLTVKLDAFKIHCKTTFKNGWCFESLICIFDLMIFIFSCSLFEKTSWFRRIDSEERIDSVTEVSGLWFSNTTGINCHFKYLNLPPQSKARTAFILFLCPRIQVIIHSRYPAIFSRRLWYIFSWI